MQAGEWDVLVAEAESNPRNDLAVHASTGPLVVVSSYTHFKELAHQPRGTEARFGLHIYRLNAMDGNLTLLSVEEGDKNLAFTRFHPDAQVLYACTESLMENGKVLVYRLGENGCLEAMGSQDAGGTSTCYLTVSKARTYMLLVNYWSSSVVTLPIDPATHALGPGVGTYHPKGSETTLKVKAGEHIKHDNNDLQAQKQRQLDPHTHAVVLDPYLGCIAYVPDLGMDVIHELFFNRETGQLNKIGDIPVGPSGKSHGPRYIEFHDELPICYVINEISSQIAVFSVDKEAIQLVNEHSGDLARLPKKANFTLLPLQAISTIPSAFPRALNTCGRITCHPSGRFVIVSNRGHNSLSVFRVKERKGGRLALIGWTHTQGATPRHFQFDPSGQWLIVANQDSDALAVFQFNLSSGRLQLRNTCPVKSPNFVAISPHETDMD